MNPSSDSRETVQILLENAGSGMSDPSVREFLEGVENVSFSDPTLVWVGKADDATTVGALKDRNGLLIQYSAELSEEQIEEVNSSAIEAGDWALISLLPFMSEESLTVTMKNGEAFTIRVTEKKYAPKCQ